ncbi:MAG: efflux transporter outer membrane subunit [Alphaproteobacteria bacterium]|nr:MAG: efflux transporter outer membrane subunit [Alphaproteobacteria bacterium]
MKNLASTLAIVAVLSGCSLIPEYLKPNVDMPTFWKGGKVAMEPATINADWWKNFNNKELNALMDMALANNNDLRAALARVQQARASARIAGAELFPTLDATGNAGGTLSHRKGRDSRWDTDNSAGLSVGYELDLFGGNRAGVKAARARLTGSVFDHDALALVLMGDVARQYFSLVNLRERVAIAESNLVNERNVMKIVQARFDAGSSSALDVSRQKAEVATNEAALAALKNQASISENALSVLLGQAPKNFKLKTKLLSQIKAPKVPLTQPSAVAQQRPDIRKSEQDLIAANADIGVARAALFPSINLGATALAAFNPAAQSLALAASLVGPIFHGGALQGGVQKATAREMELAENYRKIILTSLQEVENALSSAKAARAREQSFSVAMAESRKTYNLSRDLYQAGSVDYQTMLDSQRTLLSAEDSHAQSELELLNAIVDLYKALGGGWHNGPAKPAVVKKAAVEKSVTVVAPAKTEVKKK